MLRDVLESNKGAILIFIEGKEELAVTIIDFSRKSGLVAGKLVGAGKIFKNEEIKKSERDGNSSNERVVAAGKLKLRQ